MRNPQFSPVHYFRPSRPVSLALGLLICSHIITPWLQPALAKTPTKGTTLKGAITKDFLPPVASINGPLNQQTNNDDDSLGPVTLSAVHSPASIQVSQPVVKLDTDLGIKTSTDEYQELLKSQKALDEEDLRTLWDATVEKNPVIRFALEKLSTPADLQPKKSSQFMNKTLNVLISGATLAATMAPGGGYYRNMGAVAGGDAVRNILNGGSKIPLQTLTPTEQIQLAGLVDELQAKLVQTYHDYKNTLQTLATAHDQAVKSNTVYHNALQTKNDLAILAAASAYYKAVLNETDLKQKAKLNRLRLERLAGDDALKKLKLSVTVTKDITASTMAQPVNLAQPNSIEAPPAAPDPETDSSEAPPEKTIKSSKKQAVSMPALALPPEPDRITP